MKVDAKCVDKVDGMRSEAILVKEEYTPSNA